MSAASHTRWELWDVDQATKRRIKAYAAAEGITIAQALKELIDRALGPQA